MTDIVVRSKYRRIFMIGFVTAVLLINGLGTPINVSAQGSVYYIAPAPAGNDSNPGTITHPWQTIRKAANTLGGYYAHQN